MILKGVATGDPENLLSVPTTSEGGHSLPQRSVVSYENLSAKYKLRDDKNSDNQYCRLYSERLTRMRSRVEENIKLKWGKNLLILNRNDLSSTRTDLENWTS